MITRKNSIDSQPTAGSASAAGWYEDGTPGILRRWDGHLWTDQVIERSSLALLAWTRRPFAFLGHKWFGIAAAGYVVGLVLAIVGAVRGVTILAVPAAIGTPCVMVGFLLVLWRRIGLGEAVRARSMVIWGLVGGVVA